MRSLLIFIGILLATTGLNGAVSRDYRTIESRSGQIRVRWLEQFRVPPILRNDETAADIIVLSPELLTVSAERIKEGLLELLGSSDRWRGKIRFRFGPGKSNPDLFQVQSQRFTNGWSYQVTISPKIRRQVWLRGCVSVFLLEMANRMADLRSAEVPVWLIEGISMELSQSALIDLSPSYTDRILVGGNNPGLGRTIPTQQRRDPILATRAFLGRNVPVSATELFLPTTEHLRGNKKTVYRYSAHFFFRQLTALPTGKVSLAHFMSALTQYLNWQQAFFPSFQERFTTMLDLEKWWSVALTDLTQLTPISSWTLSESLGYLDRILTASALVGKSRDELAQRTQFTLQELMNQWAYNDQRPTLEQILNRLRVLHIYAHPKLRLTIQGYLTTITSYLEQRREVGFAPERRGQIRVRASQVVSRAQRKLNELDVQRQGLRTQ